ncbi:hypothetical protein T492DRAFT_1113390 [Pavlovales sp. CCMP2436]|nr:hypothetical protein T492DRAFT_1113390 [Pavlovales sp. CCMP2436]
MMKWELISTQTQLSTLSLAQLLPFLRESNNSERYQLLARMKGAQASPFMTPQSTFPAKDPNTNLNKIEYAILRGTTVEKEQLTEEINNTPWDRLLSSEALALMQNSGHAIRGNKISETTIKHIDKTLRDTLIKAINSNQQTRWVAHLPRKMTAAFDGPIYHPDPDDGSKRLGLWKPGKGTIATYGSHMLQTNTAGASAAFRTIDKKIQVYLCTVPGDQNNGPAEWAAAVYALRSTDPIENLTILVDLLSIISEINI